MDYHKLIDGVIIKVRNNICNNYIIIFFILGNNIPAQNAYNIKGLTGIYFNSKYRSSKMISKWKHMLKQNLYKLNKIELI